MAEFVIKVSVIVADPRGEGPESEPAFGPYYFKADELSGAKVAYILRAGYLAELPSLARKKFGYVEILTVVRTMRRP